jgi:hypothetical protein
MWHRRGLPRRAWIAARWGKRPKFVGENPLKPLGLAPMNYIGKHETKSGYAQYYFLPKGVKFEQRGKPMHIEQGANRAERLYEGRKGVVSYRAEVEEDLLADRARHIEATGHDRNVTISLGGRLNYEKDPSK